MYDVILRPHPKIRRTIKWTGLALSAVLVVVWVGSGWVYVSWRGSHGRVAGVDSGLAGIGVFTVQGAGVLPPSLVTASHNWQMYWFFEWWRPPVGDRMDLASWSLAVPLWLLLAPTALISAAAWRFDILARRRARIGKCAKCGYDLKGLAPGAACPECGRECA